MANTQELNKLFFSYPGEVIFNFSICISAKNPKTESGCEQTQG